MKAITPDDCEWYTPPEILSKVYKIFPISLDPCSPTIPNVIAEKHYTKEDNGLKKPWIGNIFLNPPYGRAINLWIDKLINEWNQENTKSAILLIHVKTDTKWWAKIAEIMSCWCSISGRVKFISPDGKRHMAGTFPSTLILLTKSENIKNKFIEMFGEFGQIWIKINSEFTKQTKLENNAVLKEFSNDN